MAESLLVVMCFNHSVVICGQYSYCDAACQQGLDGANVEVCEVAGTHARLGFDYIFLLFHN